MSLTAQVVKAKARDLGADLVGIAAGETLNRHPPDPKRPQTPESLTLEDSKSVIVLARKLLTGLARLKGSDDRHKQYSTELILTDLEEIELKLVYFLEDARLPRRSRCRPCTSTRRLRSEGRHAGPALARPRRRRGRAWHARAELDAADARVRPASPARRRAHDLGAA